jgi:hypothetical protein
MTTKENVVAAPVVTLTGNGKPEEVKTDSKSVEILTAAHALASGMAGQALKTVYSDFGAQVENYKTGALDMSRLRVSDKTHQAIVKYIRSTERMIDLAKAAQGQEAPKK